MNVDGSNFGFDDAESDNGRTDDRFLSPKHCAEYLDISLSTLKNMVRDGILKPHPVFGTTLKRFYVPEVKREIMRDALLDDDDVEPVGEI